MKRKNKHIEQKKLSAYLDGELDPGTREEIKSHLVSCEYCKEVARDLTTVSETLEILEGLDPDPYFVTRTRARVLSRKRTGLGRVLIPAIASAAALVSIILGSFLGSALFAGSASEESAAEFTEYLGSSPAEEFPTGSFGELLDEVYADEGGNS